MKNTLVPNRVLLIFRIFVVTVSLFGMGYRLITAPMIGRGWLHLLDILGYFSIQSSLLVLFVFLSLLFNQLRGTPEKAVSPGIRGAALLYIIASSILFLVLFNNRIHETGLSKFVLYINNVVSAIFLIIDNSLSIPYRSYKWSHLFYWLIYPVVYLFFSIIESVALGHFRYYIFNFSEYGIDFYLLITLLLTAIFVIIGSLIIFVNNSNGKQRDAELDEIKEQDER